MSNDVTSNCDPATAVAWDWSDALESFVAALLPI
jgi:hypothetical protein